MPDSKSFENSRRSNALEIAGLTALLAVIAILAASWCFSRGYVLYYGDAEAHLDIARKIVDSRTPGAEQIGTAWLPLPHVLMIPFVMHDAWWRNGLAGTIPSSICLVIAGAFLFAAARRVYGSASAALAVALLYALNPNVLYLQSTPMTESLMMAAVAGLLWATLWFHDSQSIAAVIAAAAASNAASLTRYEGWFLIPFVTVYFLWTARNKWIAVLFGSLAALAPLAWLAHNRFYYSNALEFYNGQWSALAINGNHVYPGFHNWDEAIEYYAAAVRWICGWPTILIGAIGIPVAFGKRMFWPLAFLSLAPFFYIWSMHSAGTPIFLPDRPPYGWYNTRYALAGLLLAAFGAGALVTLIPARFRIFAVVALVLTTPLSWAMGERSAVTWKESDQNSTARRSSIHDAAQFLATRYRPGDGVFFSSFGELAAILREAGIPLREGLHDGNGPAWLAALSNPDIFLHEQWALAFAGDEVSTAVNRVDYRLEKRIELENHAPLEIYQRR